MTFGRVLTTTCLTAVMLMPLSPGHVAAEGGNRILASGATVVAPSQVGESLWKAKKSRTALGRSFLVVNSVGASATFRVKGRRFVLRYVAGSRNGKLAVLVNGKRVRTIDQYAPRPTRRSVSLRGGKSVNTVQVVALATRNPRSRGTRVNVDAFSPTSNSCGKGCRRNPRPVEATRVDASGPVVDAAWYPRSVPATGAWEWNVAVGSYVRARDVLPIDTAVPVIRDAACAQARAVHRGIVILSFGRQVEGGSSGFERSRYLTYDNIAATASAWASGLAECGSGPWEVSIGTSNSGGRTAHNGFTGGQRWARVVEQARAMADPRVTITGAVDLEPGWGPVRQARRWVDGYVATTQVRLWNFGSADGCPQTVSARLSCNNGWTIDDVLWVSSHAGPNVVAMPQIHTQSGSQSRQWAVMAARAAALAKPLRIGAITVQTTACTQVAGGCPKTGLSAWDGWAQLRRVMDSTQGAEGTPVGAPMDIRWGWADGFVIPPETTTTTSTTTSSTTSSTTTSTTVAPTTTVAPATSTTTTTTTVAPTTTSP